MADITVYNAVRNCKGDIIAWKRTVLPCVHVETSSAVSPSGSSGTSTSRKQTQRTLLIIWLRNITRAGLRYVPSCKLADLWDSLWKFDLPYNERSREDSPYYDLPDNEREHVFSLKQGDYIAIGDCADVPDTGIPLREFVQTHNLLEITAVEECLYGSASIQHWEVTAQ